MRLAASLPLLALAACESVDVTYSTDYDSYHMFGDRLDAGRGVRMLCWPADGEGDRFRCVEDRVDRKVSEQPVLVWPEDVRLPGSAGSVIVVLPPGASEALRARAGKLADDLTRGSSWAGRHFVTADSPWVDVAGGEDLAARLGDLHRRAREWRATESEDGLFLRWEQLAEFTPHAIVFPLAGEEDRQLVLRGIRRAVLAGAWEWASREILSTAEILALPTPPPGTGQPALAAFEIAIPDTAGPAARERGLRLASDLLRRADTSVYLRNVTSPGLEMGGIRPEEFQPPYICDEPPRRVEVAGE
ncbi:MAG: hypothetical protein L6Q95_13035 [Planctomycetes bacterium]|nr:hypothetical protein [Planctomycetota bacterium]